MNEEARYDASVSALDELLSVRAQTQPDTP
jgi:hypothetical protein